MAYRKTLNTNILWQRRRVLTAGITTTAAVSTCRRPTLTIWLLAVNVGQWLQNWPASATKQNMILSGISRKSSRFYRPLCKHCFVDGGQVEFHVKVTLYLVSTTITANVGSVWMNEYYIGQDVPLGARPKIRMSYIGARLGIIMSHLGPGLLGARAGNMMSHLGPS